MAKQLVNPFERHVDKGVLGLAGLLLIGAVVKFLITSPNQLDLGGEYVTPSTIDRKVAMAAGDARDRLRNAHATVEPVEPLYAEFLEAIRPFETAKLVRRLPAGVQFGAHVPLVDVARVDGSSTLVQIAKILPDPPIVLSGRSVFFVRGDETRKALNWVTLSVRFNVKQQMENQGAEYGAARKKVTLGPLEMQRREQREDGSWSDDDWGLVRSAPAPKIPALPRIGLVRERDRVYVSPGDRQVIDAFERAIAKPETQLEIIRPLMHRWVPGAGDPWSVSNIASETDIVSMDAYYQTVPENRYADASDKNFLEEVPADVQLDQAERDLEAAWKNLSVDGATTVFNTAITIEEDKTVGQAIRKRAATLKKKADRRLADIKRVIDRGGSGAAPGQGGTVAKPPLPYQQLWAHDAMIESIESGKTYQYRVRALLYNRLVGEPTKFEDKSNAQVIFIPGEWSRSVEVEVEPDTHYWVTGSDERKQRVNVEIYLWTEGVWTKSARFKFGVGDEVRGESRHDLPPWEPGGDPENALVSYDVNAEVVDIDYERRFRERRRGKGRDGVKFAAAKKVCSVVLMDRAGRLFERFIPIDKDDPTRRQIKPYKPPKEK